MSKLTAKDKLLKHPEYGSDGKFNQTHFDHIKEFTGSDMVDFAEAYEKQENQKLRELLTPIIDAVKYAEQEENAEYVITTDDKKLLNEIEKLLTDKKQ